MSHRVHKVHLHFSAVGNLILPNDKPDVDFLIRATAKPRISQCLLSDKQIMLKGYVDMFIEYVAAVTDNTQPIISLFYQIPFDKSWPSRHSYTNMQACLKCIVKHQRIQLASPREINAMMNISISKLKVSALSHSPLHHCPQNAMNLMDMNNANTFIPFTTQSTSNTE